MTPKKSKKYALSIQILLDKKDKPTLLRGLTKAEVYKKIKEYTDTFIKIGIKFTITGDWEDFED